jgi:putative alpha-1,2-mannosidase
MVPTLIMLVPFLKVAESPLAGAPDRLAYCNAVQNRTGFLRYPLGTVGVWSTAAGETADVITRVPRVYPCLGAVLVKATKEDWRATVTGDPSRLTVTYQQTRPPGGSVTAVTATPHVAVFRIGFPAGTANRYVVLDFRPGSVDSWAALNRWTDRRVTRIDDRTLHATVGAPGGNMRAHYVIRTDMPCVESGTIDASTAFARFDAPVVTVAVAVSFTSLERALEFLAAEFTDFDAAHQRCRAAWNEVLDRVQFDGDARTLRMAYTALYTMYANIIDGQDGSCYARFCPRPRTIASSPYWQFIGGFQSCCWDNVRTTYPFLMLAAPDVMADVVRTYLARYERDGCVDGNICLYTGPVGDHRNVRMSPLLVAQAYQSGIAADYSKLYAALKANYAIDAYVPPDLAKLGYVTQPASGGKACSETLEFATSMHAMALMARVHHDAPAQAQYVALSRSYAHLWDPSARVFRVRAADGSWGPIDEKSWTWNPNPQGLFEGTSRDWMFAVPHDPYGLIDLPGQDGFDERLLDYCRREMWFNDYQYSYPYLLYYAGLPGAAQRLVRETWVPLFREGVMYEGVRPRPPHNGWQDHYSSNAGWLLCSMIGLYPVPAPPGQFVITTPSLRGAILGTGKAALSIRATPSGNSAMYVKAIKVDGKPYPSYMIPARRLAAGARIEVEICGDLAETKGGLFIGSSDGSILSAELVSDTHLRAVVEAAAAAATTLILSPKRPSRILVNGREYADWSYNPVLKCVRIPSTETATIDVFAM